MISLEKGKGLKKNFPFDVNGLIFLTATVLLLNFLYVFEMNNNIRFFLMLLIVLSASVLYSTLSEVIGKYGGIKINKVLFVALFFVLSWIGIYVIELI